MEDALPAVPAAVAVGAKPSVVLNGEEKQALQKELIAIVHP